MDSLTAAGIPYAEMTLRSGKRLLLTALMGNYEDAVDMCRNQFGSEVLLTVSEDENIETAFFITANRNILTIKQAVWLRAKHPYGGVTWIDGIEWIDANTDQVIPYHNIERSGSAEVAVFLGKSILFIRYTGIIYHIC